MQVEILVRDTNVRLTEILREISRGYSYQQILERHPGLGMGDIMAAAQVALDFLEKYVTAEGTISIDHLIQVTAHSGRLIDLSKIRETYPRAFKPWRTSEEAQLVEAFRSGVSMEKIAESHQRKPGAIRSRLEKLGLIDRKKPSQRGADSA